jgi:large conductance mechanosensitive channel
MKPPIGVPKVPGWVEEFRNFILRGNVVDLAVGVVIGAAFTGIVNSLVRDIFNPVIGLIIGGIDFSNLFIVLRGDGHYPSVEAARAAGAVTLNIGVFLNAVIQFLIVAFVIFWVVKSLGRFAAKFAPPPPPPTASEKLLTEIRDILANKS